MPCFDLVTRNAEAMDLRDNEVELKLAVRSPSARTAACREVVGARARALESIYFDTHDRRLRSAGYSLRIRKDRGRWLQTVKREAPGAVTRYEHECRITAAGLDLARLGETPVGALVAGDELAPVFTTRVRRRSKVRQREASTIEFSLDEGHIVSGGLIEPILELELELISGPPGGLFDEARRLASHGGLMPAFTSKSARGHALTEGTAKQPPKIHAPELDEGTPTQAVFEAIAQACLCQLTLNFDLLVAGARLEALHQARVALRRLRVALTVFKSVVADGELEGLKAELRWLTGELGDARNLDVFIFESFRAAAGTVAEPGPMAAFGRRLLAAQEKAYDRARAAAQSVRFRALLVETARWISDGEWRRAPVTAARAAVPALPFAREALARRRRAVKRRAEALDWSDPLERHRLRIQIKKMRYASDFFVSFAQRHKKRHGAFDHALENLQERLGALNDIWVGQKTALLALEGQEPIAGVDYAAGIVVGQTMTGTRGLIKTVKRACRDFLAASTWW
jgi:inorganic triphosphatase YgiF